MNGLELSKKIAGYLDNKKAQDIRIIKIDDLTVVTDYIVIATGNSTTQVKALADEVDFMVEKELEIKPARVEGYESKNWILLDYTFSTHRQENTMTLTNSGQTAQKSSLNLTKIKSWINL